MNAYPDDYVVHNLPLIVLSGLGEDHNDKNAGEKARTLLSEGGFRITTDLPLVKGDTAKALLQTFLEYDSTNKPWHGRNQTRTEFNGVFRIHSTGRTFALPPRTAPPPARSPRLRPATDGSSAPLQLILHSPFSPLTPSSPLYPDGIMTPLWITKHHSRLPSVFISFLTLISDANTSTLQDNKLKSEIYNMRSALTITNYKTRLVVVLVGDGEIDEAVVEERLSNIRKAINLDSKSLYYLPAGSPQAEIPVFCRGMLNDLYTSCIEYYRDLSKHARRKRNRNIVPQPTVQPSSGTSRTLPLAGWNVRYEFKLGVFAEFRQEVEAALRNYETAYESLFGPEVFEAIPSWSPRFNESRMLSDIIAIRIIRCLLWLGQTTVAVRSWTNHRDRIQSLVDRRGTGTEMYGWEAWQSTWSRTMAQLIHRAQALAFADNKSSEQALPIFLDAEKTLPIGQRYGPWENLHHEGYWLNIAQRHTQRRRDRALQMPEEDRASPGQSPASVIASKSHLYDKYLTLEPHEEFPLSDKAGYNYTQDIIDALDIAISQFSDRGQVRMIETLQLKKATELMGSKSWGDAITILEPVWENQSWRQAGWWLLLEHVGQGLLACAKETVNTQLIAKLQWQLANPVFTQSIRGHLSAQQGSQVLQKSDGLQVALDIEHSFTRYTAQFTFAASEGHVGEVMDAQICIQHLKLGIANASAVHLSQIKVVFEGGLKPVYLIDDNDGNDEANLKDVALIEIELEDAQSRVAKTRRSSVGAVAAVSADVNLKLDPGQTKVFQMHVIPREAGDVVIASITMTFKAGEKEMTVMSSNLDESIEHWWELRHGKPTARLCGRDRDAGSVKVLPKPPKIDIQIPELRKAFYTDETIELVVKSENHEDQTVRGLVEARLLSPGKNNAVLQWKDGEVAIPEAATEAVTYVQRLSPKGFGEVEVGGSTSQLITISNIDEALDHELELIVNYALLSNPETKLTKVLTVDLPVIRPFEANFSFHSRLHEEEWPSFFSAQTISQNPDEPAGIKQQYLVTAMICSFAAEDVSIESAHLITQKIVGGAKCTVSAGTLKQTPDEEKTKHGSSILIHPDETKRFVFDMTLQSLVLGNRQPIAIDVHLEVRWKRKGVDQLNMSTLHVPRFLAPSAEPRVLLQAARDSTAPSLYRLNYTIENPSLHFLTFNLNMESSDDFAFSGTKTKSLSLVPVSRHGIMYRILPQKSKAWIRVHLEVVDAYFKQTLRTQPASDGVRVDKQGQVFIWVE